MGPAKKGSNSEEDTKLAVGSALRTCRNGPNGNETQTDKHGMLSDQWLKSWGANDMMQQRENV